MSAPKPTPPDVQAVIEVMKKETGSPEFPLLAEISFETQLCDPAAIGQRIFIGWQGQHRVHCYLFLAKGKAAARLEYRSEEIHIGKGVEYTRLTMYDSESELHAIKLVEPLKFIPQPDIKSMNVRYLMAFLKACFIMKGLTSNNPIEWAEANSKCLARALAAIKRREVAQDNVPEEQIEDDDQTIINFPTLASSQTITNDTPAQTTLPSRKRSFATYGERFLTEVFEVREPRSTRNPEPKYRKPTLMDLGIIPINKTGEGNRRNSAVDGMAGRGEDESHKAYDVTNKANDVTERPNGPVENVEADSMIEDSVLGAHDHDATGNEDTTAHPDNPAQNRPQWQHRFNSVNNPDLNHNLVTASGSNGNEPPPRARREYSRRTSDRVHGTEAGTRQRHFHLQRGEFQEAEDGDGKAGAGKEDTGTEGSNGED